MAIKAITQNRVTFTDFGHGQKEDVVIGDVLYIKEPYVHYGFSKGWSHWIERHNRYSTLEVNARINNCPPFANIFSKHGSVRNPALKSWLIKVPGWPLLRFIHTYILKLGFLEGLPGLTYCINLSFYEHMIVIKKREMLLQQKANNTKIEQEISINETVQMELNS